MADNNRFCANASSSNPREMVCIETNRVLDSCRDRDCFEDVRVNLTDFGQEIIDHTSQVRVKESCIAWAYIGITPVQFNRGFYTVTIKFFIKLVFEACVGGGHAQEFEGVAVVEKSVILYGSESNVSIFKSNPDASDYCKVPEPCCSTKNVPIAIVEAVDPIVLSVKVLEEKSHPSCCCCCSCDIPESVTSRLSGTLCDGNGSDRYLSVAFGIFSVVRIVRPAQYLVQATEYCVPDKECMPYEEKNPCNTFRSMAFPTGEFCPPTHHPGYPDPKRCGC